VLTLSDVNKSVIHMSSADNKLNINNLKAEARFGWKTATQNVTVELIMQNQTTLKLIYDIWLRMKQANFYSPGI